MNILKKALLTSGKSFDAKKYFLIFSDNIGQGQSSKPSDGLRMSFPQYNYEDRVELQQFLITEQLKISHLNMIVGGVCTACCGASSILSLWRG